VAITEVSLSLEDGNICQVFTKTHIITADDPADSGAEDEGPTPLELVLAGYASSAAIAVNETAARLGIEVEEIQVSVQWRTSHRRLLDPGETVTPLPIRRELRVRVGRDITESERDALIEAAKGSPVDRALAGGPKVEDALYIFGYADPDAGEPA